MNIPENLKAIKSTLPGKVVLVAVTKTHPVAQIMEAYEAGQRVFGENKILEMEAKCKEMPTDVEWHMIGHVQRNKVKFMASFVSLIHAVDSLKLLAEIDKEAKKNERHIACLLQIKIAEEESKFGLTESEAINLLASEEYKKLEHVKIKGLMGMASFTENEKQVAEEFGKLNRFYLSLKEKHNFTILSIGMSGDYKIAMENGSTMVRIGSAIFGTR